MNIKQLCVGIVLITSIQAIPVYSASVNWSRTPYTLYSNQENLGDVITGLASSEGIPVEISDSIDDVISGNFENMTRGAIFEQLVSAYGLSWYFDGHRLYVDRLENTRSATIRLNSIGVEAFKRHLMSLGVFDEDYQYGWKAIKHKKIVYISGPAPFVDRVKQMASALDDRHRTSYTVYKWTDAKGLTHFSSDPSEAPQNTEIIEVHSGGYTSVPQHAPEESVVPQGEAMIRLTQDVKALSNQ